MGNEGARYLFFLVFRAVSSRSAVIQQVSGQWRERETISDGKNLFVIFLFVCCCNCFFEV